MSPLALLAVAGAAGFALGHALNHGPSITKVGAASRRRAAAPQPQQPAYCCYGYCDPYYPQESPYYPQQYAPQPYYPQQYAQPYYPQPYPEPYIAQPGLGGYGMPSGFQGANAQGYEFASQPGRAY